MASLHCTKGADRGATDKHHGITRRIILFGDGPQKTGLAFLAGRANQICMRSLLHVGCGFDTKAQLPRHFQQPDWREIRLDIDPAVKPDILGTMTDLSAVPPESVDAVYSSHNLEHLFPHEVPVALREFLRVLKPEGFALITCPDLQEVCRRVADGKLLETLYVSASGPIAALDVIYGFRGSTRLGNQFMAHRCGFTLDVLLQTLRECGFGSAAGFTRADQFALWTVARKDALSDAGIREFVGSIFPG